VRKRSREKREKREKRKEERKQRREEREILLFFPLVLFVFEQKAK
jgi:hypothetical protein